MRKRLIVTAFLCCFGLVALLFAGPAGSGALFLMLPNMGPGAHQDLPESYEPRHQGHVDLSTGLYIRENDDLVVRSTPPLILRRTYLSGYRNSKQFGIGTTHPGEAWLYGDGEKFQWAQLIQATGVRISFERTSPGTSHYNAMYRHRSSRREWDGAMLGWMGLSWVLRMPDGGVSYFLPCGHGLRASCSILSERDADGHVINYLREGNGRLLKMVAEDGWIAFEYDEKDRITRAHASTNVEIQYAYDARGRLSRATSGKSVYRYSYTDRDELETMTEPGKVTVNRFDGNGRVIHQVTAFDGDPVMYTFNFSYRVEGNRVVQVESQRFDGTSSRYEYNAGGEVIAETHGAGDYELTFTYERDPTTNAVTSLTLTCPDRTGRPLRHFSLVRDNEDWIKWDLVQTRCSWNTRRQLGSQ